MIDETGTSCEVAACGVSVSADGTRMSLYLGSTEAGQSFEFTMPKDLALHMSSTIQRLINQTDAPGTTAARARNRIRRSLINLHDPTQTRMRSVPLRKLSSGSLL